MVGSLAITACDNEPKPSTTASLTNRDKIHSAMSSLEDAVSGLETAVNDFQSDNWRDVVSRVTEESEAVRGALDDLRTALGYER